MPIPTPQKRAGLTNIKFSMCRLISTKTKEKLKEKLVVMHLGKNADLPYQYNKGKKKTKKNPHQIMFTFLWVIWPNRNSCSMKRMYMKYLLEAEMSKSNHLPMYTLLLYLCISNNTNTCSGIRLIINT